jgi:hypothetical protein
LFHFISQIKSVYPKFVHARAKGNIVEIDSLKADTFNYYADVKVSLRKQSNDLWWDVWDDDSPAMRNSKFTNYKPPCAEQGYLTLIVFSDKISPSSISFITEQG